MFFAQAEVILPVWLVLVVIAVPSSIVAASTIFSNQRKAAKSQATSLINEMVVEGRLPSATKQQRLVASVATMELQMSEVNKSVEVMAIAQREANGDVKALTVAQAATDAKVTVLMEHFGLES